MATVLDIVTRAFRKIGVVAHDEAADANQIANGLEAFNMMVHGWKLRGADFVHTDQGAADTFAHGDEFQEGTVYILASRLSPDYVIPASFDADDWFRTFQAAKIVMPTSAVDKALIYTPVRRAKFGYTLDDNQ